MNNEFDKKWAEDIAVIRYRMKQIDIEINTLESNLSNIRVRLDEFVKDNKKLEKLISKGVKRFVEMEK